MSRQFPARKRPSVCQLLFRLRCALPCLILLSFLAGCQTTTGTGTGREVCLIWTPATYSAKGDTPATIDGNRALNAKRDAFCKAK